MTGTIVYPRQIWLGTVPSGTFRLIDLGPTIPVRFQFEIQKPKDLLGGDRWDVVNFGYSDLLIAAFKALMGIP